LPPDRAYWPGRRRAARDAAFAGPALLGAVHDATGVYAAVVPAVYPVLFLLTAGIRVNVPPFDCTRESGMTVLLTSITSKLAPGEMPA